MEREFRLPDIGEGLTEAEIVRWLVAEGEAVDADQPVVEVETDKAVVEIPSPYGGVVLKHGGVEGETLEVGAVLVVIGEETEEFGATSPDEGRPGADIRPPGEEDGSAALLDTFATVEQEVVVEVEELASVAPIVGSISEEAEMLTNSEPHSVEDIPQVKALPVVRKLARDKGVDLTSITATGPHGRITREDVINASELKTSEVEAPEVVTESPPSMAPEQSADSEPDGAIDVPATDDQRARTKPPGPRQTEVRPMSRLRRTIASNMSASWSEVPHVTTFDDVDASRLLDARTALAARHDMKFPIEALVVKAALPAIDEFPEFNATLDGDDLILHGDRDIGIAVDTADGLLVAVIRDAAGKGVLELAREVERLGIGARDRSLSPGELTGQTFTISNIGAVGGGHGTPIVPRGTTAILSVGRAKPKPIVDEGDLIIAPVMPLSLSYDHRVIDGGLGRRFIGRVIENLEEPALFLAS